MTRAHLREDIRRMVGTYDRVLADRDLNAICERLCLAPCDGTIKPSDASRTDKVMEIRRYLHNCEAHAIGTRGGPTELNREELLALHEEVGRL